MVEVVQRAETDLKVQRPNIYAAISQSTEVETVSVDGSVFKICRMRSSGVASYPQIEAIQNSHWKAECQRALTLLTESTVDIGLFLLARQFDSAMHTLLENARDFGGLHVAESDIETLQGRIDWVVDHKIFGDKATLHLLRVERQERGTQVPTDAERKALMKFSPFLVALYLDYLILIEKSIAGFKNRITTLPPSIY